MKLTAEQRHLTAEQRRKVKSLMEDEGNTRAEAVAWVRAMEPGPTKPGPTKAEDAAHREAMQEQREKWDEPKDYRDPDADDAGESGERMGLRGSRE